MQSRATRFWLRFDSGARQGEQIPLAAGVVSLGRRPENTIVVNDGSVSGRHAELRVGEAGADIVDLGSTNGTKVKGQKVEQVSLLPGDSFVLGSVRFTLVTEAPAAAAAPRRESAPTVSSGSSGSSGSSAAPVAPEDAEGIEIEGLEAAPIGAAPSADIVESVGSEQMARARSRSRSAPLVLLLLVLAAGVAAWRFWPRAARGGSAATVSAVPGNLLADGSFEGGAADAEPSFESAPAAPQGFGIEGSFARSGRLGIGATLAAGEWAFARSTPFALAHDRRALLSASVSADEGVVARVGIELSRTDGKEGTRTLWAEPVAGGGSFVERELAFTTWTGFDRGRVVLAARHDDAGGGGSGDGAAAAFDDLAVVAGDAPLAAAATFDEFAAQGIGSSVVVARSGSLFLGPIEFGRWSEEGLEGFAGAALAAEASPKGFALRWSGAPADAWLAVRGPQSGEGGAVRVATLGAGGYQAHASEFERAEATAVLLGEGLDLVELAFDRPVTVLGTTRDGAAWLVAEVGPQGAVDVQLTFKEERAEATLLESRARAAESAGDFGAALGAWSELLDRVPFEARLVESATAERAQRLQTGLEALAALRAEFERGRFFQLAELFREVRARAEALCDAYAGSEVERGGRGLISDIDGALAASGVADGAAHAQRVAAVLQALNAADFPTLRARVAAELDAAGRREE